MWCVNTYIAKSESTNRPIQQGDGVGRHHVRKCKYSKYHNWRTLVNSLINCIQAMSWAKSVFNISLIMESVNLFCKVTLGQLSVDFVVLRRVFTKGS